MLKRHPKYQTNLEIGATDTIGYSAAATAWPIKLIPGMLAHSDLPTSKCKRKHKVLCVPTHHIVEPCSLKSCTPVGSTPLNIHSVGVVRFCLGSYVDHLGQRHPLDIEIPNVYYVPQSSFNILSTTHLKRYQITFNTQFDNDVLIMPGLPSQVTGIWGDWHQMVIHPYISC